MEFFWFLVGVVALGALAYGVFYFLGRKQMKIIEEINVKKQKIMAVPITETLHTLKQLNLTGQTKRTYESWQATWQTVTRFRFPEIEAAIVNAEQYTERLNYLKASQTTKEIEILLEETKKDVDKIFDALRKLLDSEEQNRVELDTLQERYSEMRKKLLAHGFSYGDALETLEKRLSYLELDFTKFNSLTNEHDHLEAKEVLSRIKIDLNELEEIIESVPAFFTEVNEQQEQLEDLQQGYNRLKEEEYQFAKIDIEAEMEKIQEAITLSKGHIATTELGEARKQIDKTAREIDQLYDVMEAEIEAKRYVNAHKAAIEARLTQVLERNRYVLIEIDRISQNYILNNNEAVQAQEYTTQLEREQEAVEYYADAMVNHKVPYSVIKEHYELVSQKLNEIDENQVGLVSNLTTLRQQEKSIRDNLDVYELDLRNMKRTIEKCHLPGIPEMYKSFFLATSDKIVQLSQKLNRVKIDMREINQLNSVLEEDVEALDIQTEEIIDHSQLTEYMIQYANRYRLSNDEIEAAIQRSLEVYRNQFNYSESLAIIEQALNQVEPGAGDKVRSNYESEKQNPFY